MNASRFLRKEERVLASIACRTELLSEVGSGAAVEAASAVRRMVDATGVIVASNSALSSAALLVYSHVAPNHSLLHSVELTSSVNVSLSQAPPSPSTSHFQQSARPPIRLRISGLGPRNPSTVDLVVPAKLTSETDRFVKEIRRLVDIEKNATSARVLPPAWLGLYPDIQQVKQSHLTPLPRSATGTEHNAVVADSMGTLSLAEGSPAEEEARLARPVVHTAEFGRSGSEADVMPESPLADAAVSSPEVATGKGDEAIDRVLSLAPPLPASPTSTASALSPTTASSATANTSSSARPTLSPALSFSNKSPPPLPTVDIDTSRPSLEYPNPHEPKFDRTAFIRRRMYARTGDWSEDREVRVRVGTYNVNDHVPNDGTDETVDSGMKDLVGNGEEEILVFGFQEVDLRGQAMLISQGASRAEVWSSAILTVLGGAGATYERIAVSQYVGVLLLVFVKKDLRDAVSEVQMSEKGIGLLGFGGNKAGVAVRFRLYDTAFCFVNSHLAAFANALDRRRTDYATLNANLNFSGSPQGDVGGSDVMDEFSDGTGRTLEDCHALFWMGDLNYRIDMPDDILSTWVEEKKYSQILDKDQLRQDIGSGKSFMGFHEGNIDFAPTYKYVHNTPDFDSKRASAYTDRILFRSPFSPSPSTIPSGVGTPLQPSKPSTPIPSTPLQLKPTSITCERYGSHDLQWSDHRPVSGTFSTRVRVPDEEKRRGVIGEIKRELERLEAVYKPSVLLNRQEVAFGDVHYRRARTEVIRVSNNGRVPADLSFKSIGPQGDICKPFFWVHPAQVTLDAGGVLDITVVCFVGQDQARTLTAGGDMNDVLVLQVAEGSDTFIPLTATFQPSIIAIPLSALSESSTPMRSLATAELRRFSRAAIESGPRASIDPYTGKAASEGTGTSRPVKEVWRCLEHLIEHAGAEGVWVPCADLHRDILVVIEALDTGADFSSFSTSNSSIGFALARPVSLALLHILQSLPEPLIPDHKAPACAAVLIGLMSVVKLNLVQAAKGASGITSASSELVSVLADSIFSRTLPLSGLEGRLRFVRLLMDG